MSILTVSAKGWVVIPIEFRRKYKLSPGTQMQLVDYGGVLSLIPFYQNPIQQAKGILKGTSSLTKTLLTDHAQELANE
jgi:bifunctional DNA-binding transcriptional regulator/antitoxin component of YhaV-PrlF toxin-antitoxin module